MRSGGKESYLHAFFDDVHRGEDNACKGLSVTPHQHVPQDPIASWDQSLASLIAAKIQRCCRDHTGKYGSETTIEAGKPF